ncbi:hypothetical protein BDB00DRAFT_830431 [Zychaea mexicana]|uniref:uncharacterized protein n=1 Tax=Zychaea mexicana TaxID=64656 RepID=UPI0022FE565C|nr:uncharacterized protein BDB00DRAFT_830431 [Zychaea mexicana]KAI9491954.1 hypothetical protein BDB00DRAFT_830431 [Zychaea mexicana]
MPTLLSASRSEPFPFPDMMGEEQPSPFKEIIKQLAAQAPKPYGAIPPLLKKRRKKSSGRHERELGTQKTSQQRRQERQRRQQQAEEKEQPQPQQKSSATPDPEQQKPMRRMSHVEDWIVVDSKESLPDDEEVEDKGRFKSFLYADFFTQVLPLHMPPPSLSAPPSEPIPIPGRPTLDGVQTMDEADDEELEEEEDDEDEEEDGIMSRPHHHRPHHNRHHHHHHHHRRKGRMHPHWKSDGEEEEEEEEDDDEDDLDDELSVKSAVLTESEKSLVRRHSISSFSKAQTPSTLTTPSYAMSSSPPQQSDMHQVRWVQTIAQLRRSLVLSSSVSSPSQQQQQQSPPSSVVSSSSSPATPYKPIKPSKKDGFIPMPPAPRRPASQRRRSEATTQPRFNPDTNTYTRDTRSNPDHLRIISSELNMIRARKLLSPLKPRGFLPRRKDPFVRGDRRRESNLRCELV